MVVSFIFFFFFFFKQKTAYEMRISDWSSDVCSSDLQRRVALAKSGAISAEELAHASDALTTAQNALITAQQQYQTSKVLVDDTVVASHPDVQEIGRASCRERVCQYV